MTSITSEAESFFLSFLLPLLFIPFYDFSLGLLVLFILIFWISFYGLDSFGTFSLRTFIRWILFFGTQSILWKEKKKKLLMELISSLRIHSPSPQISWKLLAIAKSLIGFEFQQIFLPQLVFGRCAMYSERHKMSACATWRDINQSVFPQVIRLIHPSYKSTFRPLVLETKSDHRLSPWFHLGCQVIPFKFTSWNCSENFHSPATVNWMAASPKGVPAQKLWMWPYAEKGSLQMCLRILKWDCPGLSEWALNSRKNIRDRGAQSERRGESRNGGDAATSRGPLEPPEAARSETGFSPRGFGGSLALKTPWFQAYSFQNCEKNTFLFS